MKVILVLIFSFLTACSSLDTPAINHSKKSLAKTKTEQPRSKNDLNKKAAAQSDSDEHLNKFRQLISAGQNLPALIEIDKRMSETSVDREKEQLEIFGHEILETRLTNSELESLVDKIQSNDFISHDYFILGKNQLELNNHSSAKSYFAKSFNQSPQSEYGLRAKDLLTQLEATQRVESQTIGVVLPLSGKFAPIAQKTLRGIQMGLGLSTNGVSNFKLAIADSAGNPDSARKGVENLVKEDNVIAIIGSMLSKTASAVASKSSELGVPSIALSQKNGITETSAQVFRNSITSEMQVRYLVKLAMEKYGMKRFAVLYPNDQYGVEYTNIFWDEVLARGGTISSAQIYSPQETDFGYVIQRLVGTYYLEDRADEYKSKVKEWLDQQKKKTARTIPPDDLLPPIIDFDAIFIPDSTKTLGQISAMLSFNGVKDVMLLGTNLWNNPDVVKRSGSFNDKLLFVDSFLSGNKALQRSQFFSDYKLLYNEDPGPFEIQGYDSALVLKSLILSGSTSRESLTRSLSELKNFQGLIGSLSVSEEHEIIRPLNGLTLKVNEIFPISN